MPFSTTQVSNAWNATGWSSRDDVVRHEALRHTVCRAFDYLRQAFYPPSRPRLRRHASSIESNLVSSGTAALECPGCNLRARFQPKFVEHMLDVHTGGTFTDHQ